ncbi:MAG: hypothetical protein Q9214_004778 [Letrouitia sp. 1 TL-2023]
MIYNVTRTDPSQGLQNCLDGFQNIIDQCISGGNYWGGTWSLNGFTYAIYNHAYPSNGLGPNDSGGPSSTDDSNPSTTGKPGSTTAGISVTTSSNSDEAINVPPSTAALSFPGETIVTETNSDGAPITATVSCSSSSGFEIKLIVAKFAPTTLSQYATLKSETTITTTTTRDGVPIVFPLVIGAGGVAWGIIGGAPPPGITPPGGVPGDGGDGDDGDDGDDGSGSIQSQTPTSTIFLSSIASSTVAAVTAIGDINYDDWQAINQVPL